MKVSTIFCLSEFVDLVKFCNILWKHRAAIEYEKKGYAENYEHGQVMEKKLISMARELEKLRAEMANAERRARATVAVGNPGLHSYIYTFVFFIWFVEIFIFF